MADTPIAAPEEQDKGPQQIDTPPYPGTSKIENGQAFDVSGKVLGAVDDSGKAVAKQAAPPQPAGGAFDFGFKPQSAAQPAAAQPEKPSGFDFGFKPAGADAGAAKGTKWESYARMGNYFYAHPMEGEENKGVAHSLHSFLSFPNALYHAFQDPATNLEKAEIAQKMNQMRAGQNRTTAPGDILPAVPAYSTLPAVPDEFDRAVGVDTSKSPSTPTRTQVALHRLIDAPADELDAKANKELETARELWDNRQSWGAMVPVGMGISIPMGHAIALSQSVSGAADKMLSKVPMLGPLVNGIAEKFENGDVSGGLTDIALLKAAEHVHGKMTGEEPTTPSRIFTDKGHELGKGAKAAYDAFKESTVGKLKEAVKPDVSTLAEKAKDDFVKSAPPSKAANYSTEPGGDYDIVRRTAEENHKADKLAGGEGISGIETARDIIEDGRQSIEAKRAGAVQRFADKPITTNVFEDVANSLADADQTAPGFRDEGMKILEKYNFKDLTNKEADAIRKKLVAENRLQVKNPWDAASLRETSPEFAAREAAIDSLRKGIYGSLDLNGVPEAYDWARDEAAHIRVRNAVERQIFNAEKSVRGSGEAGPLRRVAAATAKAGSTAVGTGVGAAVGGVPGAIIGGAAGTVAGEGISRAILPSNLTRNELMARSFSQENLATPEGPSVPRSQDPNIQYPEGPAGPDLPPPPQPIPPAMPPPDHALHAALATRIGTTVERSNLDNLLSKFQEYLDNTPANKLTEGDRDLLQQLNESQAERKNKVTEAVQKAFDQNKAAREKWQADVKKIQEKHAAEQEAATQKAIDDTKKGETPTDENPHLASLGRSDESGLVSHSPAMKAHSNIGTIEGGPEGLSPEQILRHEWAHIAMDAVDGEPTGHEIRSDSHPKITPGSAASAVFDASQIKDAAGNVDPEALQSQLTKWLTQKLAGPASHEVFDGMTKDEALAHPGTRVDVRQARAMVRDVHPEFSPSQVAEVVDGAYERARDFISQPHIGDRIKANAVVREDNLATTHHASRGRVSQFQKDILEAHNEFEGTTNPEPSGSGTGEGGEKAKKPEPNGKKNAGGEKAGSEGQPRGPAGKPKAASGVAESEVSKTAPEKEEFSGVHYSSVPAKEGVISGATRGAAKAGSEQARVALGAEPGVYAYREGARPESQIASRANKYSIKGDKAIADISGAQKDLFQNAYQTAKDAALKAGDNDTVAGHKGLNAAETAVKKAGYDGYEHKADYPGNVFLFGDQSIGESAIKKPGVVQNLSDTADEFNKAEGREPINEKKLQVDPRQMEMADAYAAGEHAPNDPKVKAAYDSFKKDIDKQFELLGKHGIKVDAYDHDPYEGENLGVGDNQSGAEKAYNALRNDVIKNKHVSVWKGGAPPADHPLSEVDPKTGLTYNLKLRAIHDVFGHVVPDNGFDAGGEESAWGVHNQMFSPESRAPLATETRAQTAYVTKHGEFANQKAMIMPKEFQVRPEDLGQTESTANRSMPHWWNDQINNEVYGGKTKGGKLVEDAAANGGFTVHPRTGEPPTDGYMVEVKPKSRVELADNPKTTDILDFVNKNRPDFDKDKDLYAGGYHNSQSGKFELNVAKRFDNLDDATKAAKANNQISLWDVAKGEEVPTGGTGKLTPEQISESSIAKKYPKGSSVPLMDNPLPVKGTMEGGEVGTLDLTKALNKFSRQQLPALEPGSEPKEMVARAKKLAEDEAKYQLAQSKTGTEWYTTEMKDHDKVLQDLRPELAGGQMTDAVPDHPVNLTLFKAAEAILSSGQKPYANVKSALRAWDAYKETGEFPRSNPTAGKEGMSWGPRNVNAYGNAFDNLNRLISEKGEKGAADWLLNEHPVSELKDYKAEVGGKKTDVEAGAKILGEKRGPFMQNLHGIESKFTADMWVSRTWNRWMGTLDLDPRIESKGKMTSESDVPRNNTERGLMKESFEKTAGKLGLSISSLQAVLWYYEQALYRAHGLPVESWSFSDAAKRVAKEASAAPESEQTGFNFGENAKKQGVMEGLAGKPPQVAGRVPAFDFINSLKKK